MNHVLSLRQKLSSESVAALLRDISECAGYNNIGNNVWLSRPPMFKVLNEANLASFEQYQSVRLGIDGAVMHNYGLPK